MTEAFCRYCGAAYAPGGYPKTCRSCHRVVWNNPIPVAVLMQPVCRSDGARGLVLIRRSIAPHEGALALPGGFVEMEDQSFEAAAVREFFEETGLRVAESDVRLSHSFSDGTQIIVFVIGLIAMDWQKVADTFVASSEGQEIHGGFSEIPLAFPSHTQAMSNFLHRRFGC